MEALAAWTLATNRTPRLQRSLGSTRREPSWPRRSNSCEIRPDLGGLAEGSLAGFCFRGLREPVRLCWRALLRMRLEYRFFPYPDPAFRKNLREWVRLVFADSLLKDGNTPLALYSSTRLMLWADSEDAVATLLQQIRTRL